MVATTAGTVGCEASEESRLWPQNRPIQAGGDQVAYLYIFFSKPNPKRAMPTINQCNKYIFPNMTR